MKSLSAAKPKKADDDEDSPEYHEGYHCHYCFT